MSRSRSELSPSAIDLGWPHQVAIPGDRCSGKFFDIHREFCRNLSLCSMGHSLSHKSVSYRVFCFADPDHATAFLQAFEGVPFYPEDRGKGTRWMIWNRPPGDVRRTRKPSAKTLRMERAFANARKDNDPIS